MPGGGTMRTGSGQVTDDSEMAMCLLHSLNSYDEKINNGVEGLKSLKAEITAKLDLIEIQKQFGRWRDSQPFDIGMTTRVALYSIDLNDLDPNNSYKTT